MVRRDLQLPVMVIGLADLGRLIRELATIDEQLLQLSLRQPGSEVKLPKTTQLMDQLLKLNRLNLLQPEDRAWLKRALDAIRQHAPVMNVSFSVDPSTVVLEKLMIWLRREIHPFLLIGVGLQPNIAAGCIVRTTNKVFDFSLRQNFANKRDLLRQALIETPAAPPSLPAPGPVAGATP
jgi:hypothetical protein